MHLKFTPFVKMHRYGTSSLTSAEDSALHKEYLLQIGKGFIQLQRERKKAVNEQVPPCGQVLQTKPNRQALSKGEKEAGNH